MSEKITAAPDELGHFGIFGGRYVPEILIPALDELIEAYNKYKNDPEYLSELNYYMRDFRGAPHSAILREKAIGDSWRSKDIPETRRPLPYRRP